MTSPATTSHGPTSHGPTSHGPTSHNAHIHRTDALSQHGRGHAGYGRHRDVLAHALTDLLTTDQQRQPALSEARVVDVLGCRDLLLSCLVTLTDQVLGGAGPAKPTLQAAATAPARVLATTLRRLPRATTPRAPTKVLACPGTDPTTRSWKAAARAAVLAADALTVGEPATWRTNPDAAWAVMADTAAAAHALAVLDRRLATTPQLPLTDEARRALQASWRTGLRLVATELSRLAHTHPLAADADTTARPPRPAPFPVTDTTTVLAGYQHTHRLLAARHGVLPLRALGHLLAAQARLAHTLADHCQRTASHTANPTNQVRGADAADAAQAARLADRWRAHAHTAETLLHHRRATAGLNPATSHPALTQLGEVLRAVHHLTTTGDTPHPTELLGLAQALAPSAVTLERTIAAGIECAFTRGAYLVANDHVTKRRGRLPWIPATPDTEPHPLLTAAIAVRTDQPQQAHKPQPRVALPDPTTPTRQAATAPTPAARRALHQAIRTNQPARIGPPTMTQH